MQQKITPAKAAKNAGLKNLSEVAETAGVTRDTLRNWFYDKPELFAVVIRGVVALKEDKNIEQAHVHNENQKS